MAKQPPPDGVYSRRSDPQNKQLPKSERFKNYCASAGALWPVILGLVGLLGYTNAAEIKSAFASKSVPTPEDVHSIGDFESQVLQSLEDIVVKLKQHDVLLSTLQKQDTNNQGELLNLLQKLEVKVDGWHE